VDALTLALGIIDRETAGRPDLAVLAATARGLLRGYHARWCGAAWQTVSVEDEYRLPIINPDTGKPSRTFTHAGKFDGIAEFGSQRFLVEHKTCSEEIEDPDAPYWRRLEIDAQVSGYMLAQWQFGTKLDGTLYDVIRRPGIRPKALTKADRESIIRDGLYCDQEVSEAKRLAVSQNLTTEDADLFELRLTADTMQNPARYYQRKTIYRMDAQILEFARELWETADEMRLANLYGRHYRNTGSCMQFNRPCEYLGICSGHDAPDSHKWTRKPHVHEELTSVPGDGRNVLTTSRIQCFRTCRRKEHYRYGLGIKRTDREEAEALYFGSLFHAGLAAWWANQSPSTEVSGQCHQQQSLLSESTESTPIPAAGSGSEHSTMTATAN
jgi:hypothetical protein